MVATLLVSRLVSLDTLLPERIMRFQKIESLPGIAAFALALHVGYSGPIDVQVDAGETAMDCKWICSLELNAQMKRTVGSEEALRSALGRAADLRIGSEFFHDEHVDTKSNEHELVEETMDMRVTYVVDGRWCAGIQSLRQPVELPDRFGPRPSLSLFMYNENGLQAIARPYLDGPPKSGIPAALPPLDYPEMPKYQEFDRYDDDTNSPSSNFRYAFEKIRFLVRDDWQEALHHRADGDVISGSIATLAEASRRGCEIKVGIRSLCDDLADNGQPLPHEVFIQAGSHYYYTQKRYLVVGTHPLARVRAAVPMTYRSRAWDYAWLIARTDGHVSLLIYDPYTLVPRRENRQLEMRWFYR